MATGPKPRSSEGWEAIDESITARQGTPSGTAMAAMLSGIPLGRLETPDDVAGVVSFLASPDAAPTYTRYGFIVLPTE